MLHSLRSQSQVSRCTPVQGTTRPYGRLRVGPRADVVSLGRGAIHHTRRRGARKPCTHERFVYTVPFQRLDHEASTAPHTVRRRLSIEFNRSLAVIGASSSRQLGLVPIANRLPQSDAAIKSAILPSTPGNYLDPILLAVSRMNRAMHDPATQLENCHAAATQPPARWPVVCRSPMCCGSTSRMRWTAWRSPENTFPSENR